MRAIEVMTLDDVVDVLAIDAASFQTNRTTESHLIDELRRPFAHLWVIRSSERRVAAFLVAWHVVDEVHVLNVATHPVMRRRGFGRALMEHVLAFARDRDARHVLLEVRRSNAAAVALYRGLGFFAMGIRRNYYPDGEDAIEMVLLFDPATKEVVRRADEIRLENH